MDADNVNRRIAAWLLNLPPPVPASSLDDALHEWRRRFDPRVSQQQFERGLTALGYGIRIERAGFAISTNAA